MNDPSKWQDKQAQLLADIDAFARGKQDLARMETPMTDKEKPASPAVGPAPTAVRPPPAAPQAKPAASASPPPSAGGSLLERLKSEAQAKKHSDTQDFSARKIQAQQISDSLMGAFQYLRDLVEQLNVIKPAYPLSYNLLNLATFDNMNWQEGFADYRLAEGAQEERLVEKVTLRLRFADARSLRVERESPAHETFSKALFEANIPFQVDEKRNERGKTERAVFTFNCEVKAGLAFGADYAQGNIRLLLRNMQRFGSAEYRLPPDALNQDTLEQLAQLILGEPSRIEKSFRRVA